MSERCEVRRVRWSTAGQTTRGAPGYKPILQRHQLPPSTQPSQGGEKEKIKTNQRETLLYWVWGSPPAFLSQYPLFNAMFD